MPVEVPTQEGPAFVFLGVDVVSELAFQTGVEDGNNIEQVLKHIALLMRHKDFKPHKRPFTLVLHKYAEHRERIDAVLKPYGGKVAVDDGYLIKKMGPLIGHMFKNWARKT